MLSIGVGDRGIPTSSIFKPLLKLVPMGMGAEVSLVAIEKAQPERCA
jgi:hypothetical protein